MDALKDMSLVALVIVGLLLVFSIRSKISLTDARCPEDIVADTRDALSVHSKILTVDENYLRMAKDFTRRDDSSRMAMAWFKIPVLWTS